MSSAANAAAFRFSVDHHLGRFSFSSPPARHRQLLARLLAVVVLGMLLLLLFGTVLAPSDLSSSDVASLGSEEDQAFGSSSSSSISLREDQLQDEAEMTLLIAGGPDHRRPRRYLTQFPGSYPPRCAFKCGACTPCYPVHVPVPPGVPVTTEYYPEAWRCKCEGKLYMP